MCGNVDSGESAVAFVAFAGEGLGQAVWLDLYKRREFCAVSLGFPVGVIRCVTVLL